MSGKNSYTDWAKIIDCGDAPLTFLDNTIALKQLEKAHKVTLSSSNLEAPSTHAALVESPL